MKILINPKECFNCGQPAEQNHHIVPKLYGGIATIPLCQKCHDIVHNTSRTNLNYLIRYGMAKKIRPLYSCIILSLIFNGLDENTICKEFEISNYQLNKIIQNLHIFTTDDIINLIEPDFDFEKNTIFRRNSLKNMFNQAKNKNIDLKTFKQNLKERGFGLNLLLRFALINYIFNFYNPKKVLNKNLQLIYYNRKF